MTGGERLSRDGPRARTWNFRVSLRIQCFRPGGSNQHLSVCVKYQKSKRQIRARKIDNCIINNIVTSSVRDNSKCIVIPPSRTDQYKHSFFIQTGVDWNHLDENTVSFVLSFIDFALISLVSFYFVLFSLTSFRFVSFLFRFALDRYQY
jgi:hypothetical protein